MILEEGRWHAPHPTYTRRALCGKFAESRYMAKGLTVTCPRCKRLLEAKP